MVNLPFWCQVAHVILEMQLSNQPRQALKGIKAPKETLPDDWNKIGFYRPDTFNVAERTLTREHWCMCG